MTQPDFNADERYIIAYFKHNADMMASAILTLHVLMTALFVFGLYHGNKGVMFSAFAVIFIWRCYEERAARDTSARPDPSSRSMNSGSRNCRGHSRSPRSLRRRQLRSRNRSFVVDKSTHHHGGRV
jgi:hypothetical protein